MLAEPVETADGGGHNTLDTTRTVVIKFMADEVQFRNEVKARADAQFDPNFVVSILATSDAFEGFAELSEKLGFYRYAIVMEAGERNIHSVFVHERPDEVGQGSQSCTPCHTQSSLPPSLLLLFTILTNLTNLPSVFDSWDLYKSGLRDLAYPCER